jgi:caffeoyl-CoA O-methyltransferase
MWSAGLFDLIFINIDKQGYPDVWPVVRRKLRADGVCIADNVLWGRRVFDERNRAPSTEAIREFTHLVLHDPVWLATLVPIRDGLLIAYIADERVASW